MLLSDILNRPVLGPDGEPVGFAVDVRFVLDGAPTHLLAGAVLHRVLVSPRTASSFFGYERSGVTAPWPLGRLFERRHRGSFFVEWADIARFGSDGTHLREGYTRLPLSEDT